MYKLAITGSIASGKSKILSYFAENNIPVFSFDQEISKLLSSNLQMIAQIQSRFPLAVTEQNVNKQKLKDIIFKNDSERLALEQIIYPFVFKIHDQFIELHHAQKAKLVAIEVPLLYEKNLQSLYDGVLLAVASKYFQRKWVMQRPGMTPEKFYAIKKTQIDDNEKREKADFIIRSDLGFITKLLVKNLIRRITK